MYLLLYSFYLARKEHLVRVPWPWQELLSLSKSKSFFLLQIFNWKINIHKKMARLSLKGKVLMICPLHRNWCALDAETYMHTYTRTAGTHTHTDKYAHKYVRMCQNSHIYFWKRKRGKTQPWGTPNLDFRPELRRVIEEPPLKFWGRGFKRCRIRDLFVEYPADGGGGGGVVNVCCLKSFPWRHKMIALTFLLLPCTGPRPPLGLYQPAPTQTLLSRLLEVLTHPFRSLHL